MASRIESGLRLALLVSLGAVGVVAAPAACLYPDYSFDEPEPTGSGGGSTSSSGNGGATSSTGQGGGGGQGGQGGGVVEDCLDGTDDDGDGAIDCADSDCNAGYACVPSVPVGWSGFVALFEGAPGAEPACPDAFPSLSPYQGNNMLTTPPHTCSECTCGAPMGQTCDLPDLIQIQNVPCGGSNPLTEPLAVPANWAGSCYGPSGWPGGAQCNGSSCNASATAPKPTVTGGSCAAQGGTPDLPAAAWSLAGKACGDAPVGAGCGMGKVCQPKAEAPFFTGLCVFKGGDNSCPAGSPFSQNHLFYEDLTDTRACSTCTCGAPTGSTCDATITIYGDQAVNTCTTAVTTFPAGGCGNISGNPYVNGRKATITQPPTGGGCAPAGNSTPSGALTPSNATTFCCIP